MSKINKISIIMPLSGERISQLFNTICAYESGESLLNNKEGIEFVFVVEDSSYAKSKKKIQEVCTWCESLGFTAKIVQYDSATCDFYNTEYFNPAMALNYGVKECKFNSVIVTSPEIKPLCDVIGEFRQLEIGNYICKVLDESEDGGLNTHGGKKYLVGSDFRSKTPAMYFLAMFRKRDILKINGWDMRFMQGYCFEDEDFGNRFMRAGLTFEVKDNIQAIHQYHPRKNQGSDGWKRNKKLLESNNSEGLIRVQYGIEKE